ncbi:MAG: glycosyltransferase [Patescibacteria group bacterium]|nr:glycosyltransferase [Patescibacteria group bacterium]
MKVIISLMAYRTLTGSELYTYELARALVKKGHEVMIVSNLSDVMTELHTRTKSAGIDLLDFKEYDGKFKPDILHLQHLEPTKEFVSVFPNIPAVVTVHSELIFEQPFKAESIKKYVCVKKAAKEAIIQRDGIAEEMIEMIPIPVDFERFHPGITSKIRKPQGRKLVISPMTVDWLRRQCIFDLIHRSFEEGFDLWIVGAKLDHYLNFPLPAQVKWFDAVWDIERFLAVADETAGVKFGKMTIESLACGKPSWVYDVTSDGMLNGRMIALVPPDEEMKQYDSMAVADRFIDLYKSIL